MNKRNIGRKILVTIFIVLMSSMFFYGCNNGSTEQEMETSKQSEQQSSEKQTETSTEKQTETSTEKQTETSSETTKETSSTEATSEQETDLPLVYEYGEMNSDFYYIIEDTFAITEGESLVVVGVNYNSPMYVGAEVDILSVDNRISCSIAEIEIGNGVTANGVPEGSNTGVFLAGVTKDQVKPGDIIVLKSEGVVANKAEALVATAEEELSQEYIDMLSEGQSVQVYHLYGTFENAVIEEAYVSEDGLMMLSLLFEHDVVFSNWHSMAIFKGDSVIAGGYMYEKQ